MFSRIQYLMPLGLSFCFLPQSMADSPPSYNVTQLTIQPGYSGAYVNAIGSSGDAVGLATPLSDGPSTPEYMEAYAWIGSTSVNLFASNAGVIGQAMSINSSGQIVGYAGGVGPYTQAFLYQSGALSFLPTPGGDTVASAINDNGQIAGNYSIYGTIVLNGESYQTEIPHPLLWQNGVAIPLPEGSNGNGTAVAINNRGDVLINSFDSNFHYTASIYNGQTLVPLNASGNPTFGLAMNNSDDVVGTSNNGSGQPFAYIDGSFGLLPLLPGAAYAGAGSINDADVIVGDTTLDTYELIATLWENGNVYDLNSLIPADSGWVLNDVSSINDAGEIAGVGTYDGQEEAFLLTPNGTISIPEPAAIPLAAGFCLLAARRRTKASS